MKPKGNNLFHKFINNFKTKDPVFILVSKWSKAKPIRVAVAVSIVELAIWIGTSEIVSNYYPDKGYSFVTDLDEFGFGFFLWGVFVPVLWWFYLSLPNVWKKTLKSLYSENLVDADISEIIPKRSFAILSFLLSLLVGSIYRMSIIPAEIESGRISFWFATEWTMAIEICLLMINSYIFINFVLDVLLISIRMSRFFNKYGIQEIKIYHIDGCGGFGKIGSLAMRIASLIVVVGLWAFWFSFLPKLAGGEVNLDVGVLLIYIVYIVLVPIILFLITWPAQKAMKNYKQEKQEELSTALEKIYQSIADITLTKPSSNKDINELKNQYQNLLFLYETAETIPERPISLKNFKRFTGFASFPGILGFVTFVLDIVDFSIALK